MWYHGADLLTSQTTTNSNYKQLLPFNRGSYRFIPQFRKFIFTGSMTGGLGNQMSRFASLYAIGQLVGRSPIYLTEEHTLLLNVEKEIAPVFPNYYEMLLYIPRHPSQTREFNLTFGCCDYHDPYVLQNISEPLLELTTGINFQNYKFFDHQRAQIREIFNISSEMREKTKQTATKLYRDNKSHKLCIHIRTGDFKDWHWESKADATSSALAKISSNYTASGLNYSLVFVGEDKEFFKQMSLTDEQKRNMFVTPSNISRTEEMCLAILTCDSLLITAHVSTYAFWIGYLMPEKSSIYYIANYTGSVHGPGHFPPQWIDII